MAIEVYASRGELGHGFSATIWEHGKPIAELHEMNKGMLSAKIIKEIDDLGATSVDFYFNWE